jgi:uncharacterized protein involved in exopolysaccharide biosynthesis
VLRRRGWVVALVVAVAVLAGVVYDSSRTRLYEASARVLLSRDSPAARLTGATDEDAKGDRERFIRTQIHVARTVALAKRVLPAAGLRDQKPRKLVAVREVVSRATPMSSSFASARRAPLVRSSSPTRWAAQFTADQR